MLPPDEAKRRLAAFEVADPRSARRARIAKLPKALRELAEPLDRMAAREHPTSWGTPLGHDWRLDRAAEIDALSIEDRTRFFAAFLPAVASEVELGWRALVARPYQSGYARRAFRAPHHPRLTADKRMGWLFDLVDVVGPYEQDVAWLATWSGHVSFPWRGHATGRLLSVVIDAGGPRADEVLGVLVAAAEGRHEVAAFERYVVRALAECARPDAWACLERLLLRAQREEGLRQTILETVDEAHPECFRRMLALIAEHGLARFSAVARAVDVWLGYGWDSEATKRVGSIAERMGAYVSDRGARSTAIAGDAAEDVHLALFADALEDAVAAVERAKPLLAHPSVEVRYAVAYFLVDLAHSFANAALVPALSDADERVVARVVSGFATFATCTPAAPDLFERLEAVIARWPAKPAKLPAILWPWCVHELDRSKAARALLTAHGDRPFTALAPHVDELDADGRLELVRAIRAREGATRGEARPIVVELLGDASSYVRDEAFKAFTSSGPLADDEAHVIEGLLARKSEGLRLAVLAVLETLEDPRFMASVERLLSARSEHERLGGLELLRRAREKDRLASFVRPRAERYRDEHGELVAAERAQLDRILATERELVTLDDALGLSPLSERTPLPQPKARDGVGATRAARELLLALDALVASRAEEIVSAPRYRNGPMEPIALGALRAWQVPDVVRMDRDAALAAMPARAAFEPFFATRGPALRDEDGCEAARALFLLREKDAPASSGLLAKLGRLLGPVEKPPLRFTEACACFLRWSLWLEAPHDAADVLMDVVETRYAALSPEQWKTSGHYLTQHRAPELLHALAACEIVHGFRRAAPGAWTREQRARWFDLERWYHARCAFERVDLDGWLELLEADEMRDADFVAMLLRPEAELPKGVHQQLSGLAEIGSLSGRTYSGREFGPRVTALMERVRRRVVDVELARGEAPTVAAAACKALRSTGGLDVLVRASRALTGGSLRRGVSSGAGREEAISSILRRTRPSLAETPELLRQSLPLDEVGEERLTEIALFAPQWCAHVEHAIGWKGLADGVWWMHAHTKDVQWSVERDLRELWKAQTSERTPLASEDLLDGAVDVAWFGRVRAELGDERFAKLLTLAKFTSSGTGHTRAKLFASALLGREDRDALVARVREKRHQDSVRALGLVPLPDGAARDSEVLARYLVVQEFLRGSKQFGSQRQASEKRAASIALENLARTAGYPDPVRLEWAMERAALGDLAKGPVVVSAGDIEVVLALDEEGEADVVARKAGKTLKSIPAAAKKVPEVKDLVERKTQLAKQRVRMRASLEQAMVRGDAFSGKELVELLEHPVLAPLLARLVLVGDGVAGFPVDGGRALRGPEGAGGTDALVDASTRLRIAHPVDLLASKRWSAWQRDVIRREVVQPFKQVFRELYVLTDAEREERVRSRRYAGHQVQPARAMALLGARGWTWHAEEGARLVDHASGLAASIGFLEAPYTAVDVEGLTLETVAFTKRASFEPLPLDGIPPRLLSEVMRDVDLVVSVASRSGVDPEASASSVEARGALVRETCELLALANVRVDGRHAFVEGKLGRYSLHLGSGVVHKLPGGHLCIVPVHAQHRGRVFLPFADDDPKTAEIVSKVLLLARDSEIKDPSILEQIRR